MKEAHIFALKALAHREFYNIDTGEGSGAAIYKIKDKFILFEIPMYGGKERYVDVFSSVDVLIKYIDTLTCCYHPWLKSYQPVNIRMQQEFPLLVLHPPFLHNHERP